MNISEALEKASQILQEEQVHPTLSYRYVSNAWPSNLLYRQYDPQLKGWAPAMAAKLARLIYRMLRYGTKYVDQGSRYYELEQRTRDIRRLKLKAATLGFQLVQSTAA
jgi:hypothetical protein